MISVVLVGKLSLNIKLDVVWPDLRVLDIIGIFLLLNKSILDVVIDVFGLANVAILVKLDSVDLLDTYKSE